MQLSINWGFSETNKIGISYRVRDHPNKACQQTMLHVLFRQAVPTAEEVNCCLVWQSAGLFELLNRYRKKKPL